MKKSLLVQILSTFVFVLFFSACNKTPNEPDPLNVNSTKNNTASPFRKKIWYGKDAVIPPGAIRRDTVYDKEVNSLGPKTHILSGNSIVQPNTQNGRMIYWTLGNDYYKSVSNKTLGCMMYESPIPWQTLHDRYGFKMIHVGDFANYQYALTQRFQTDSIVVGISPAQYSSGIYAYINQFPSTVKYYYIDEPAHHGWVAEQLITAANIIHDKNSNALLLLTDYDWNPSIYYLPVIASCSNVRIMCDHYQDQWYYGHARDYETNYSSLFGSTMFGNWISADYNYNTEVSDVADSFGEFLGHQVNLGFNNAWLYSSPGFVSSDMLYSFCNYAHVSGFLLQLIDYYAEHQVCLNPNVPVERQIWETDYVSLYYSAYE